MKLFITGTAGQLGHDCVTEALIRGNEIIASDVADSSSFLANYVMSPFYGSKIPSLTFQAIQPVYEKMDITDKAAVINTIGHYHPDAIIHCAAWTAVDAAEDKENRNKVHKINVDGTRFIAEAAKATGSKMIYISTDYVFNGKGTRPWEPDDKCYAPLNVYGQSKLDGELAVSSILEKFFIVRIAWVFGLNGKNFIKTMINVGKAHPEVRVVDDQIGTPTYTKDLARLLLDMVETDKFGYYHATNSEVEPGQYISWADLAEEAYKSANMDVKVTRVSTEEYGLTVAARPFNSRLNKSKLVTAGFKPLPDWKDAVARYIGEARLKT